MSENRGERTVTMALLKPRGGNSSFAGRDGVLGRRWGHLVDEITESMEVETLGLRERR